MAAADDPESLEAIAERLVALRLAMGYQSQTAWCTLLGFEKQAWNNYERAQRRIDIDQANVVRKVTGVTTDWIYFGDTSGLPLRIAEKLVTKPVNKPKKRSSNNL